MGYSENFKGYRIDVVGQREVEISHDVTFDEDIALTKINNLPIPRKEKEADIGKLGAKEDETMPDVDEPMDPIDPPPQEPSSSKSKKRNRYQGYLIVMSTIIQNEPSSFEEAVEQQVWKDAMNEEYESIMKNDVWDVVPRPQDKSVVTSKWLYKIKHGADGSAKKFKARFVA
eukprot:PITA_07442